MLFMENHRVFLYFFAVENDAIDMLYRIIYNYTKRFSLTAMCCKLVAFYLLLDRNIF